MWAPKAEAAAGLDERVVDAPGLKAIEPLNSACIWVLVIISSATVACYFAYFGPGQNFLFGCSVHPGEPPWSTDWRSS